MKTCTGITMTAAACAVLILPLSLRANSSAAEFEPQFRPSASTTRTTGDFEIDGRLSEPAWKSATHLTNFAERYPGDNTLPAVETDVYITYTGDHLLIGFVCRDNPLDIRATMCQRDQFNGDDQVGVMIDTYGNATWAYELFVNAYGIQRDLLWSSIYGEDSGFDLIWESAAHRTDQGYEVEMAVPFSSLRFPSADVQSWRMDFWRIRPRESSYRYSWAANDRNEGCWPCQWGTISGISSVKPGKGVEILPTYVANQAGNLFVGNNVYRDTEGNVVRVDTTYRFEEEDPKGEPSFMGKYAFSSDVTLEFAGNPDFSQIESDAAQVDVNTTIALFYPERRPFFQEGADIFRTLFNSFYTRTINDPIYAVKLTARKPNYTLGFMSALDDNTPYIIPFEESSSFPLNAGRSVTNALRLSKSVGDDSHIGMIVTDRRFEDNGYGTILALDQNIRLSSLYSIDGQYLMSFTGEQDKIGESFYYEGTDIAGGRYTAQFDGESFAGNAFITRLRRSSRNWGFQIDYNQVDPDYRTQTGYDPWVNYRQFGIWNGYTFYPDGGPFVRIQPQLYVEGRWVFNGGQRFQHANLSLYLQMRQAQTNITLSAYQGEETWAGLVYKNLSGGSIDFNTRPIDQVGLSAHLERGHSAARFALTRGTETNIDADFYIKPIDRLVIEPGIQYSHSRSGELDSLLYEQFITRSRFRFQFNRSLSLRLVLEYNNAEQYRRFRFNPAGTPEYAYRGTVFVDPLLTYRISPFSVFYVGSTHDYNDYLAGGADQSLWKLRSRQFFMKLQYLFQI